jgi:hypothetical protein
VIHLSTRQRPQKNALFCLEGRLEANFAEMQAQPFVLDESLRNILGKLGKETNCHFCFEHWNEALTSEFLIFYDFPDLAKLFGI